MLWIVGLLAQSIVVSEPAPPPVRPFTITEPRPVFIGICSDAPRLWSAPCFLSDTRAAELEKRVKQNPEDLCARGQLITAYRRENDPAVVSARLGHLLWMIRHHPEWGGFTVAPEAEQQSGLKDAQSDNLADAWRQHIGAGQKSAIVLHNAAVFYAAREPELAVNLLERAIRMEPEEELFTERLGMAYAYALLPPGCADCVQVSPEFAYKARTEIERSSSWVFLTGALSAVHHKGGLRRVLNPLELGKRIDQLQPDRLRQHPPSRTSKYCRATCATAGAPQRP